MPVFGRTLLTRWPLRYTVPLLLSVAVIAGGLIGYWRQCAIGRAMTIEESRRETRAFIGLQAEQLGNLYVRREFPQLQEHVAAFLNDPTISHAWMVDDRGEVLASTRRIEIGRRLPAGPSGSATVDAAGITFEMAGDALKSRAPVALEASVAGGLRRGQLFLERDLQATLFAERQRVQQQLRDYFLYFFGIAGLLWAYFEWAIARRLRTVGQAIVRVAGGERGVRVPADGRDEIAELTHLGNQAAESLDDAHALNERLTSALERLTVLDPAYANPFDAIAQALSLGFGCRWAGVGRLTEDGTEIEIIGAGGAPGIERGMRYRLAGTPCAETCVVRGINIVEERAAVRYAEDDALRILGAESYRGAALLASDGRSLGVIYALDTRPCATAPAEIALLKTAANRVAQEIERSEAELALRDRERFLQLTIDAAHQGIWEWDRQTRVTRYSLEWARMLGHPPSRIPTNDEEEFALIHPDDHAHVRATFAAHIEGMTELYACEYRVLDGNGAWRWIYEQGSKVEQDAEGRALRVIGVQQDISRLKAAEATLRERSEFLEAAVHGSMDGLWDWDCTTDRAYFAPRFHELLGYREGELPERYSEYVAHYLHPDDADERARMFAGIGPATNFLSRDFRILTRSGDYRWFNARCAVLRDAEGAPRRFVGSISDITERKRRESELAQTQRFLTEILDNIDAGVVRLDAERRVVFLNPRYRQLVDLPTSVAYEGVPYSALVRDNHLRHPEHLQGRSLEAAVSERMDALQRLAPYEYPLAGRWILARNNVTPDGGLIGIRSDITSLKRTEQALRESEARLRTVLDNSLVGIVLCDERGRAVYGNRAFLDITRLDEHALGTPGWLDHVHSSERHEVGSRWRAFVSAPQLLFECEYQGIHTDGTARILHFRAVPIHEKDALIGFAGTLEDVTARRLAERERERLQLQVQQAQKMNALGQLTGGVAHDFNNILSSIIGYTVLAEQLARTRADQKLLEYLAIVRQSGDRARELVVKMLDFSRQVPAREVATVDPVLLLQETVKFLQPLIPTSIRVGLELPCDVTEVVSADAVDLHQALVNLAINARDACAGQGTITFGLRARTRHQGVCDSCGETFAGQFVEIAVMDSGAGIAPEHRQRLFEPFFTTKEVGRGTGMGLAVTHGVIHRAGGHITVESAPGYGTRVGLLLQPGHLAPTPPIDGERTSACGTPSRTARVVVVDDEPLITNMIREILESRGYEVRMFTDSVSARDWIALHAEALDALITDQTMPVISGLELASGTLRLRPGLPVVLCTGFSEQVDAERCRALGIRAFLQKPISFDELLDVLDGALRTSDATIAEPA